MLNTGGAAVRALADAAAVLADSGILLGWTDLRYQLANARIARQQHPVDGAPHADEIETSMMLAIDPSSVDMKKAAAEYAKGTGVLTRQDGGPSYWHEMDAEKISDLFSSEADMRHPDGTIERTRGIIRQNRAALFAKKEYSGSVHPVTIYDVRCLGPYHAVADGKWELRFADAAAGLGGRGMPPTYSGLFTLVLSTTGGPGADWSIEAWRYTVTPDQGAPPPTILKQPGFIGRSF